LSNLMLSCSTFSRAAASSASALSSQSESAGGRCWLSSRFFWSRHILATRCIRMKPDDSSHLARSGSSSRPIFSRAIFSLSIARTDLGPTVAACAKVGRGRAVGGATAVRDARANRSAVRARAATPPRCAFAWREDTIPVGKELKWRCCAAG